MRLDRRFCCQIRSCIMGPEGGYEQFVGADRYWYEKGIVLAFVLICVCYRPYGGRFATLVDVLSEFRVVSSQVCVTVD